MPINPQARPIRPFLKVLGYTPAENLRSFMEWKGCQRCANCEGWYRASEMADDGEGNCHWCRWNLRSPWEVAALAEAA
jgi:hypothetical protein